MTKQCEVAGAGFAGLTVATLLANRGWSVRVHERAAEVREIGAGIFLHHNGLAVLEEAGLFAKLAPHGVQLLTERMVDERGRQVQNRSLVGRSRVWAFPRETLIQGVRNAALSAGVEIWTGSEVVRAEPAGRFEMADGSVRKGALVIGADGYRSRVRTSLGLGKVERPLNTISTRYLLHGRVFSPEPASTEHWSGARRVAVAACGPDATYVYMACPSADHAGRAQPLNEQSWTTSFPHLSDLLSVLASGSAVQGAYSFVQCSAWSKGRVALLGDAAHALAPTLGQGTNLAMSNARTLVHFADRADDMADALTKWETCVRWVTDDTQVWASRYDNLTKRWPSSAAAIRAGIIWCFGTSKYFNSRMRVADKTPPNLLLKDSSSRRAVSVN